MCDRFLNFIFTLPHGQPHAVFGGFVSISLGWMLLGKELIMAEESPSIAVQCTNIFMSPCLSVLAGIRVL